MLGYKRKGGRLTPHSRSFSICKLSSGSLRVLRVLTRQTLEINMEVKDTSFLDLSLAKVVKDSTLTILFSSDQF
jgi:hypothetical protein